ncbi:MAG: phosphoserine aminotransferase [Actinomycetota bacterium]|nr:phosphoserine aminotransferase [Actinomycetota bacterium]
MDPTSIVIPKNLHPGDGRFGSGPSKVRPEAVAALQAAAPKLLGTSHRQAPVKDLVKRVRTGLTELFGLPDGYEVMLGLGGATVFWDAAVFGLIEQRSQHLVFGEFSSKFAQAAKLAPNLADPDIIESEPGTHPMPQVADVDAYALTHNETSTGVAMPVTRVAPEAFTLVDATSAAGGIEVDPHDFDVYYFAPQKGFASDGGLWIALCSPSALERIQSIAGSDRYIPPSLNLATALDNSRKDQTYNTPALVTLFLMAEQIDWMLAGGGLTFSAGRSARSAAALYGWAERSDVAEPFVKDPAQRSPVVGTIDFAASIDAAQISAVLRANGIVDTEPYRKLGKNQLRVAMYPAIDPDDIALLTKAIDHVIGELAT